MIEKCKPEHLDAVMGIWLRTNISAHAFIPKAYWENAFDQVEEAMRHSEIYIYRENAVVMGFIGITGSGYIAGLFVGEKYQSRGIGRKLLDYCKQRYSRLELDVFTENQGAVAFYLANGFEVARTEMHSDFAHEEQRMVWVAP